MPRQNQALVKISLRFWVLRNREEVRKCETNFYGLKRKKGRNNKEDHDTFPTTRLKQPLRALSKVPVEYEEFY